MFKVLIVDDDHLIRKFLQSILNKSLVNIEIRTAIDGIDGLCKATYFKPDAIISDYDMPYMNGVVMLRNIEKELVVKTKVLFSGNTQIESEYHTFDKNDVSSIIAFCKDIQVAKGG